MTLLAPIQVRPVQYNLGLDMTLLAPIQVRPVQSGTGYDSPSSNTSEASTIWDWI